MLNQAMQMSKGKNPQQMQQLMKNICQQKGIDYNQFMQTYSGVLKKR